ncbi:MAG: head GIN domain-containing protein [Bacteroidales bacterium]
MKSKFTTQMLKGILSVIVMVTYVGVLAQPKIPDITGVKDISVNLACKLTLLQGEKASLSIKGDNKDLENVEISLSGNRLKIFSDARNQHKTDISIIITVPDLENLSIGGAVDIFTPNILNFNNLEVEVSGVADFNLNLKSEIFKLEASGVISGNIKGSSKEFEIEISGVGKLDASEFKTVNCDAEVSGVAKISVNTSEKLTADVSGMGKIYYTGNPVVRANSSGVGKISKM